MAVVLPQGKFNNATLAYIREWILRRARLLAVVGLHPNTFKPHTGTKTSILFAQKYTDEERTTRSAIEANVQLQCPNYDTMLKRLIASCSDDEDLREENLPEEVIELLHEWFGTTEEQSAAESETDTTETEGEGTEADIEALEAECEEWQKATDNLRAALDEVKKSKDKDKQKKLKAQLREAEKKLAGATGAVKRCTLKGRVELLSEDPKALDRLRRKWIDSEVAKRLDYPVFMATSEQGGKDSSGEYIYRKDPTGSILEDEDGNLLIEQDCVKYRDEDPVGIAELFITWAKKQKLSFWRED